MTGQRPLYTPTGRAVSAPVACPPGGCGVPAVPLPVVVGRAGREVQRSVHARVSRQYQRRSRQALPPSATICSAGRRMPHIQQDLTLACRAQYRTGCGWSVTAYPPARVPAAAVAVVWRAWMFTGAAGAWNGGCSRPAARPGSRSSGRSPISDVPASYGQPVVICNTASRPLAGTWLYPVRVPRVVRAVPVYGDAPTCPGFSGLTVLTLHYGRINFR